MSDAPFVATLRARPDVIVVDGAGSPITIRVQLAEAWDTVRVSVGADVSVAIVKLRALEALDPSADFSPDYVVTLKGAEILDESASLTLAGVVNGSTLLVAHRRRRAVR